MRNRAFQIAAYVVMVLAALTPLLECFDHWDTKPGPENDTEIHLTAWFVGVGVVLTLATTVRLVASPTGSKMPRRLWRVALRHGIARVAVGVVEPTGSPPPLPLRI